MLITARNGDLTLRDVKNGDRTGYMYENKGDSDKLSSQIHCFYTKMPQSRPNQQQSGGLIGRTNSNYTINRRKVVALELVVHGCGGSREG
jgi:hypothetical protein